MLDVYKKDLKGRKQIEETIMATHGLKAEIRQVKNHHLGVLRLVLYSIVWLNMIKKRKHYI